MMNKKPKVVLVSEGLWGLGYILAEKDQLEQIIIAVKPKEDMDPKEKKKMLKGGKGLVEIFPLEEVMSRRNKMKDWYWVWDGNHNEKENDILRKENFKVANGHSIASKMEKNREFTLEVADAVGLKSPEHKEFKSITEGVAFLKANPDKAYVFKPNGNDDSSLTVVPSTPDSKNANLEMQQTISALGINDFILQEKVKGVEVNVEYFCINGEPVFAQANLEDKRKINGDKGENTGCAFDVCWEVPMNCRLVQETVAKWKPLIKKMKYTGFADVNVIVGDDAVWFLETCWRCGYNAHCNLFTTISRKGFFQTMCEMADGTYKPDFKKGFGASITLRMDKPREGLPIYIPESATGHIYVFDAAKGKEGYLTTGYNEEIAFATAHDYTIATAFERAMELAEKIKVISDLYYRTDADKTNYPLSPIRRFEALQCMGYLN